MVEAAAQNVVDVLDERKVALVERVLFGRVAVVERHLLGVVDEARVLEAELALEARLVGDVLAKGRRENAHHVGGELDEERHEDDALAADALGEGVGVDGLNQLAL